jgi:predicted TIM-barrel fold metal-dependent hydrolase
VIDCHAHVMRRDAPLAPNRHSAPARAVSAEEYLAVLNEHGLARGVLTAPSFYGSDNSLLLAALDVHPQRLRGTVIVEPDVSLDALQVMARHGAVGVRLNWFRREQLPDVAAYRKLFEHVRQLDWHVEIYVEGGKLAALLPAVRASGAKVVLDHFGSPDPAQRLACPGFVQALEGVRAGDTWVKLSAAYRLGGADPRPYAQALLDAGGPEQLVWASDWPFVGHEATVSYAQCLEGLQNWVPDDEARRIILVDTPSRLFHFDRSPQ